MTLRDTYTDLRDKRDQRIIAMLLKKDAKGNRMYSQAEIARKEDISPQAMGMIIRRLKKNGMV